VEEHGRRVYLYQSRGENAVQTDSHVGMRVQLHCCGIGKAIPAHLPAKRVTEIIDEYGLPRWTEYTITDEDELFDELETIRDRGVAIDDEEWIRGLRCVAAPVMCDGEVLGAISVSGPTKRVDEDDVDRMIDLVRDTARVIELNAKYS
jgi:DNA-binding IclR family transcriptional regulator